MTSEQVTPFRLALRVEGDKWNAYLAKPDTMQDAMWIGSILLKFVENNEHRKQIFIALMQDALAEAVEELIGTKPTWDMLPAPEHERTKN
jgi:hypothetical protein